MAQSHSSSHQERFLQLQMASGENACVGSVAEVRTQGFSLR